MAESDVRVLIVGDNPLARAGLAALLDKADAIEVVGQVAAEGELSLMLGAYRPDVLVWDAGWDAARTVAALTDAAGAAPPVLALVAEDGVASQVLSAGAAGVLPQNANADMMSAALAALAQGLTVLHPDLLAAVLPRRADEANEPGESLTPREMEVLTLVAEGLANKMIAAQLGISEHTVKFHVNAVMTKLGVQSRTEAVVRATRLGYITL